MSMCVNRVTLLGNVGRDPEVRALPNGGRVANFPLATSERWRDKQTGEPRERTEWHRIVVFNPMIVDITEERVHKGSKLYIEGQLQTRKWQDQSGQDRYTTEIVLPRFRSMLLVLDARDRGYDREEDDGYGAPAAGRAPAAAGSVEFDDEIPF